MTQTPADAPVGTEAPPGAVTGAPRTAAGPLPLPWWRRAVPVGLLAVAAVAALAVLLPDGQVAASASRQRQQFVELELTALPQDVCGGKVAVLPFRLTSHLGETAPLSWRLVVDPRGDRPARVADRGRTELRPDASTAQRVRAAAPRGAFDLRLSLENRPENLVLHCGGGR